MVARDLGYTKKERIPTEVGMRGKHWIAPIFFNYSAAGVSTTTAAVESATGAASSITTS